MVSEYREAAQREESKKKPEGQHEPMDVEEDKKGACPVGALKLSFSSEEYRPRGINDTFLPERWDVYNALYKHQPRLKHKQGKRKPQIYPIKLIDLEDFMDMVSVGNESNVDLKEQYMRVEIVAVLKLQQAFHQWVYRYLSAKVQELKKNMHDKVAFDKALVGKKAEGELKPRKSSLVPQKPAETLCATAPGDLAAIDSLVDNVAVCLRCCMCQKEGERKVYPESDPG